jgi:hypothetical protein
VDPLIDDPLLKAVGCTLIAKFGERKYRLLLDFDLDFLGYKLQILW